MDDRRLIGAPDHSLTASGQPSGCSAHAKVDRYANESAARAFDLGFLALETHVVEVWVAERWLDHPGIDALGEVLATAAFTERVAHFGGYDLAGSGDRLTSTN